MKVAILGYPRTGTNKLQRTLGFIYKIPVDNDRTEWLTGLSGNKKEEAIEELNRVDSIIAKLFVYQFNDINVLTIDWNKFDFIFATSRDSLVDSFVSCAIAQQQNYWVRLIEDIIDMNKTFIVDLTKIEEWYYSHVINFNTLVDQISRVKPVFKFTYNEICDNEILLRKLSIITDKVLNNYCLPRKMIPMGINYKEKCLNYAEVEAKFKELGLV